MTVVSMRLLRAQKQLDAFCRQRNAQAGTAVGNLYCLQDSESTLLLLRQPSPDQSSGTGNRQLLLRLVLNGLQWRLYWPRGNGEWEPYAQLPAATDISQVIEELQQAPLHVHW